MGAVIAIIAIIIGGFFLIALFAIFKIAGESKYLDEFYRERNEKHGAKKTKKTKGK